MGVSLRSTISTFGRLNCSKIFLLVRGVAITQRSSRVHVVRLQFSSLFRILDNLAYLPADEVLGTFIGCFVDNNVVEGAKHEPETIALLPYLFEHALSLLFIHIMVRYFAFLEAERCDRVANIVPVSFQSAPVISVLNRMSLYRSCFVDVFEVG